MYIVDSEQVENIYNQIKDLEVYSFEGKTIIDPAYDIGDVLIIEGKKVIYQGELEYQGKFKANIKSKIQAKTEQESMQTKGSTSTKIKRIQSEIDQANGKITQLTQETTENTEKLTQVEQDVNSIKQSVNNTINYKRTAEGITEVHLTEAGAVEILDLEVRGNKTYKNYLYPSNNLYPGNIYPNMPGFNYEEGADNSEIYNNS